MSNRRARLSFFIGTNGVGKSTAQKAFLAANARNLVWPASAMDKGWADFQKIVPSKMVVDDPKSLPGKKKQKVVYRLQGINGFTGTRIVDTSQMQDENQVIDCFKNSLSAINGFRKGGLFIDDFKGIIKTQGTLPFEIRKLMNDMRHIELDVFMATHGFREINFQFFQHNPTFYIFKSDSPPGKKVKDQYNQYEGLMQVFNRVQERTKKDHYYCEKFPL
jgi:hypothetical protein